ncbi:MAG: 30S ribosomal protein S16 [Phycisphaeraceae bacterium]
MVRIRLKRFGRRNRPFYRITAMDRRAQRDGRTIEDLGWFDPLAQGDKKSIHFDRERVEYWLGVGAQPTETVAALLRKNGVEVKLALRQDNAATTKPAKSAAPASDAPS